MTIDTVFDVASLTKIMAVWASVGMLWENGELALEDPLTALLPDLDRYPLGRVTIHQLLSCTGRRATLSSTPIEPLSSSASSSSTSPEPDSTTPPTCASGHHWA